MAVLLQTTPLPDGPDKYMAYAIAALVLLMLVGFGWLKIQNWYLAGRGSQAAAPKLRLQQSSNTGVANNTQVQQFVADAYTLQRQVQQPQPFASLKQHEQQAQQLVTHLAPEQRHNVLIAAGPGDGKTTTMNTMLVADLARGVQVVVLNPNFTYYHPRDQLIDLRPVASQFEAAYDYKEIDTILKSLVDNVIYGERLPLYREGKDAGHTIVVYIDEMPAITSVATNKPYAESCKANIVKLIREGRKVQVFVVCAAQDALVETLGLPGGVRDNFAVRLVGNVDPTSWKRCVGDEVKQVKVEQGTWYAGGKRASGTMQLIPATSEDVLRATQHRVVATPANAPMHNPPATQEQQVSNAQPQWRYEREQQEMLLIAQWVGEKGKPLSNRAITRRIYKLRGGDREDYKGDGDLYNEVKPMIERVKSILSDDGSDTFDDDE